MKIYEDSLGTFRCEGFTATAYQRHKMPYNWLVKVWYENQGESLMVIAQTAQEAVERAISLYPVYHADQMLAARIEDRSEPEQEANREEKKKIPQDK